MSGPGPGTRQEREIEHWRRWQARADSVWGWQTPAGQRRARRRADLFLELGRLHAGARVLEIGCGTGEFSARIAPHVGELVAIDLSPDLLERARARLAGLGFGPGLGGAGGGGRVRFERHDAMQLGFADATFDAAYGCSVLHHLEADRALRELERVLKPGGRLVFSEPNMLNPQIALQKNVGWIKVRVGDSPDETAFFRGQAWRLLARAGFVDVTVRPFDFLHPLTPPALIPLCERLGGVAERIPGLRAIAGSLVLAAAKGSAAMKAA